MMTVCGRQGASLDGYLNEYGNYIFTIEIHGLTKINIYRVSDHMALVEVCALQVFLVYACSYVQS